MNLPKSCRQMFIFFTIVAIILLACQPSSIRSTAVQSEPIPTSDITALTIPAAAGTDTPNTFPTKAANIYARPTYLSSATAQLLSSTESISFQILEQINLERTVNAIKKLTGQEPLCLEGNCHTISGRETGSEGLSWAKRYIHHELVDLGYSVEYHGWSRSEYSDQNIIVRKLGTEHPEEEIYFVAHLDGARPGLLSKRPAADDNASGVVDL